MRTGIDILFMYVHKQTKKQNMNWIHRQHLDTFLPLCLTDGLLFSRGMYETIFHNQQAFSNRGCGDSLWQSWTKNIKDIQSHCWQLFYTGEIRWKKRAKNGRTQCLKKQHAFEPLSIFQNKSRVLFWILKEHRAISVSLTAALLSPAAAAASSNTFLWP